MSGTHDPRPGGASVPWRHEHVFDQDRKRSGETRTILVVILTAVMMVVEILVGWMTGSIALIADGLHMASHAAALGIAFLAYVFARRMARDRRYSFGTGKINALAAFGSATMLGVFSLVMAGESLWRLVFPVEVDYDLALIVAVGGLVINGVSVVILGVGHDHDHGHDHAHAHAHEHHHHDDHDHDHDDHHHHHHHHHHHDHNLRAAYLHVLADTLTSLTAILALLGIKYFGLTRLDPTMGIIGSMVVAWWAYGLLRQSGRVLLDHQDEGMLKTLRSHLADGKREQVSDLHVWSIGPGIHAAEVAIVSHDPQPPDVYKARIPARFRIVHATVEVHRG